MLKKQKNKLTAEEQEEGITVFKAIDKDGNRRLTQFEVSALVEAPLSSGLPWEGQGGAQDQKVEPLPCLHLTLNTLNLNSNSTSKELLKLLETDDDGYISLYEWLRFLRSFKIKSGSTQMREWFKLMRKKSETMVVKQLSSKWREDGSPGWEPVPSTRPASHVVSEIPSKLTDMERAAALSLFNGIDKDGNQRLTLLEVRNIHDGA